MLYISHRGNTTHKDLSRENDPDHIKRVLSEYLVEIDVWYDKGFYLGHDKPTYPVTEEFLMNKGLWCHAKNFEALVRLKYLNVHYFWHNIDDYTITSRGYIWAYPGKSLSLECIAVLPETVNYSKKDLLNVKGICSDNIAQYRYPNE